MVALSYSQAFMKAPKINILQMQSSCLFFSQKKTVKEDRNNTWCLLNGRVSDPPLEFIVKTMKSCIVLISLHLLMVEAMKFNSFFSFQIMDLGQYKNTIQFLYIFWGFLQQKFYAYELEKNGSIPFLGILDVNNSGDWLRMLLQCELIIKQ